MNHKKLKVLLIVEQCNPDWASVPLVGYNFFQGISKLVDVTLVTHGRNREAIEKQPEPKNIVYLNERKLIQEYHKVAANITYKDKINWPLYHALSYPVYMEFNQNVYQTFKESVLRGDYDIVHVLTPMTPRYPVKLIKACKHTPFILGPVNGGLPFPTGFKETAKKENANLNFLRDIGRLLIPGYVETYTKADRILVGSTFTMNMLKKMFTIQDNKIDLFYENGITSNFFNETKPRTSQNQINLLFVGRLVPYKCADIVIESISQLDFSIQNKIKLTIVGDGPERNNLEQKVQELHLDNRVKFAGWVNQQDTLEYYREADIFCFPSIREFGGAVVLEAMACGLPCIVVNNGGIGEYVTEKTGFKIEPVSREYIIKELTNKIKNLVEDEKLRESMTAKSIQRAKEFEWNNKAEKIVEIYEAMLIEKSSSSSKPVDALKSM